MPARVPGRTSQTGLSFLGLVFVAVVVASVAMLAIRITPTVIEYQSILKAIRKAKTEPTPAAARVSFDRTASVDYFDAINGKDLDIVKLPGNDARGTGDGLRISFAYRKEIHLFGPASLVLDYKGSTE